MKHTEHFPLLDLQEVDEVQEPGWLIHGAIPANSIVQIYGKQKSGKTFLALDMALRIAVGMPWAGERYSRSGKVVYVAGEGLTGLRKRIQAWREHHDKTYTDLSSFWVIPTAVQLGNPEHVYGLIESIADRTGNQATDFIVFDTQARCTSGIDENSAQEMGVVVTHLDYIKEQTGATLVLVHHTPHNAERGRGSTAIPGALNTYIGVKKVGRKVVMTCADQKDAEEFDEVSFLLTDVADTDSVVPVEMSATDSLSDSERQVLQVIQQAPRREMAVSQGESRHGLDISRATYYRHIAKLKKLKLLDDVGAGIVRAVSASTNGKPLSISQSRAL